MVKPMVRQAVFLQTTEVNGGADIHLQPMEDPTLEQVDAQKRLWLHGKPTLEQIPSRTYGSMERQTHSGASFLARFVSPSGIHSGVVSSSRTVPDGKDTCWSSSIKNCSPWEGSTLEKLHQEYLLWKESHAGAGRVWGVLPLRRKWQKWCDDLTPLLANVLFRRRRQRKVRSNVECREKRGVGRRSFKILGYFLISLCWFESSLISPWQ